MHETGTNLVYIEFTSALNAVKIMSRFLLKQWRFFFLYKANLIYSKLLLYYIQQIFRIQK
jgi:hypothetical protein